MTQLQGGKPEGRWVPPIETLLDGLEMAEQAELELELRQLNGEVDAIEESRVIFGEGVVQDPPPRRRYPRAQRLAAWRSEGRPGERPLREKPTVPSKWSAAFGFDYLDDDTLRDDIELPAEVPPSPTLLGRAGRASLMTRAMTRAYEEREAESLATIKQSIDKAFETQEAVYAASEILPDEARRLAQAETAQFAATEDSSGPPTQSIYDSPLFSPRSVREYQDFRNRRRAA